MISKRWFSNAFSSWDTLLQVYFWWITAPKSPLPPSLPFLYSSALFPFLSACTSLNTLDPPPCPSPLVIFTPRSPWLPVVGYSKWLGGPSTSTACGDFAMGEDGWSVGWALLKGEWGGVGWGWRILSVDHHVGPGGLWWSTGSIGDPLISRIKEDMRPKCKGEDGHVVR